MSGRGFAQDFRLRTQDYVLGAQDFRLRTQDSIPLASLVDEVELGLVDGLLFGGVVFEEGPEEDDPDDAQQARGEEAPAPGSEVEEGSLGEVLEAFVAEEAEHGADNQGGEGGAPAGHEPQDAAPSGAGVEREPGGLHSGHVGEGAGL